MAKRMGCQVRNDMHKSVYKVVRCTKINIKYNFVIGKITVSGNLFIPEVLDNTSLVYKGVSRTNIIGSILHVFDSASM